MATHRELAVWRRAHELSIRAYRDTESDARRRAPKTVDQLRRAVSSIAANIAEGRGQSTTPQYRRYLSIAVGSANEADNHITLLLDLGILDPQTALDFRDELSVIRRMTLALHKSVE
ncbi:MAG: four helix bundle protein [Gemmatimonadaceae bacterium]|nr:four helix bundle protein [Gemmatimonadaceae bacterium]